MVMAMTEVVALSSGRAVARSQTKKQSDGLTLINEALDADVVQAMVNADRFSKQVQEAELVHLEQDQVRRLHRGWLPNITRAQEAYDLLSNLSLPRDPLTQADAGAMLQYLFGAMAKRRNDEAAAKLMACVDIFSPASNALGSALGLWKPAPTHPVILAVAIK
jgi:hypothetical protein